jgi:hypothetical protein
MKSDINYKQKLDHLNFQKLHMNKFKLLKPKIDASNGGNGLAGNFHLKMPFNPGNILKPLNAEMLKNPKLKNLKKIRAEKIENYKIEKAEETSHNKYDQVNPNLDSTNITNDNSKLRIKNNPSGLMLNKRVSTHSKKHSTDIVSSHYKTLHNEDIILNNRNSSHKRNKSSHFKDKEKSFLNQSVELNHNLTMLAKHLKRNKTVNPKKEEKIEILKNMVEGLTKLTTIMLEDNSDCNSMDDDKMLISSTTGNIIHLENKKIFNLMKKDSISKQTIDRDETLDRRKKYPINRYSNSSFGQKSIKIKEQPTKIMNLTTIDNISRDFIVIKKQNVAVNNLKIGKFDLKISKTKEKEEPMRIYDTGLYSTINSKKNKKLNYIRKEKSIGEEDMSNFQFYD